MIALKQGGRKVILDGVPLFIRKIKKNGFSIISNFLLYKTQKDGGPRDTRLSPPVPSPLRLKCESWKCESAKFESVVSK